MCSVKLSHNMSDLTSFEHLCVCDARCRSDAARALSCWSGSSSFFALNSLRSFASTSSSVFVLNFTNDRRKCAQSERERPRLEYRLTVTRRDGGTDALSMDVFSVSNDSFLKSSLGFLPWTKASAAQDARWEVDYTLGAAALLPPLAPTTELQAPGTGHCVICWPKSSFKPVL
jgi:hypothetical protein